MESLHGLSPRFGTMNHRATKGHRETGLLNSVFLRSSVVAIRAITLRFMERLEASVRNRQQVEVMAEDVTWTLREGYESILAGENRPIAALEDLKY
jgi:hypothetical protein